MRRLNVDYIDVIQCHDIEFVDVSQIIRETLPGAARCLAPPLASRMHCISDSFCYPLRPQRCKP